MVSLSLLTFRAWGFSSKVFTQRASRIQCHKIGIVCATRQKGKNQYLKLLPTYFSVTRFGKIRLLWHTVKKFGYFERVHYVFGKFFR